MSKLYEILGVAQDATQDEIKQAYMDLAKENHPDKKTGDTEKMKDINNAYMILSNKDRRQKYDETGDTSVDPKETKMAAILSQMFLQTVQVTRQYEHEDIIEKMRDNIYGVMENLEQQKKQITEDIKKHEKVQARLKTKGDKLFLEILTNQINGHNMMINNIQNDISLFIDMEKRLDDYEYDYIKVDDPSDNRAFLGDFFITMEGTKK